MNREQKIKELTEIVLNEYDNELTAKMSKDEYANYIVLSNAVVTSASELVNNIIALQSFADDIRGVEND